MIIVSKELSEFVEQVFIDKERKITPAHAMKNKKLTYPDHLAIVTRFKGLPMTKEKSIKPPKVKLWNTNKPGGWKMFYDLTNANRVLNRVSLSNPLQVDSDKIMNIINKELTNVKFHAFGKVKYREKYSTSEKLVKLQEKKSKCSNNEKLEYDLN